MKGLVVSLVLLYGALATAATKESVIYSFQGGTDGEVSRAGLVADKSGNFFGTTQFGGTGSCTFNGFAGCGTVFELSPDGKGGWAESVLYNFRGGKDGQWPIAGLVIDAAGSLYGTSQIGGGTNYRCPPSCGSAFQLSPSSRGWTLTVLHSFRGGSDGGGPQGGLAADASGNLYGVTYKGARSNLGTFFQLALANGAWTFKTLHSFSNCVPGTDGGQPNGTPLLRIDGDFYGTTACGGAYGGGTIYRFSEVNGKWKERIVHSYGSSSRDEVAQFGDLAQDAAGNLYGISSAGGGFSFAYRMSLVHGAWKRRNIHTFSRSTGDGDPSPYPMVDASGNVYGTNYRGPKNPNGTVFKLSAGGSWIETVLYMFQGPPDGQVPYGKLLLDTAGNVWGTTLYGGTSTNCPGCGTVFEITRMRCGGVYEAGWKCAEAGSVGRHSSGAGVGAGSVGSHQVHNTA